MEQTIVLRKAEEVILHHIINEEGQLMEWYMSSRDLDMKEAIGLRNRIVNQADSLMLLHAIHTGRYEIADDYQPGDILVRTKDRPFTRTFADNTKNDRVGDFIEVAVASDRGVTDTQGEYHRVSHVRPANEIEKKFHAIGRSRVEFKNGDHVHTLGGQAIVGGFQYEADDAMRDLEYKRVTGFYPVESRIEIM